MTGRDCAWRSRCPEVIRCRQLRALYGPPLFLLRETGPLGFVILEEGRVKPVQVRLGGRHYCSCRQHRTQFDLCLHICWVLLRRFRLKHSNPISFQLGLVPREITTLLRSSQNYNRHTTPRHIIFAEHASLLPLLNGDVTVGSKSSFEPEKIVPSRPIAQEDSCPICLEGLLEKRLPVTHCRYSCGNHVHIRCMQIWIQHHNNTALDNNGIEKLIKCPFCRGKFNSPEALAEEIRNAPNCVRRRIKINSTRRLLDRSQQQSGFDNSTSTFASVNMIRQTENIFINNMVQSSVSIIPRSSTSGFLKNTIQYEGSDSSGSSVNPKSQQSSDSDFIQPVAAIVLAQSLPVWRIPQRHRLLAPGRQCCLCLAPYQVGHVVSGLPCGHEFHASCLRPWLHRSADESNTSNRTQSCRCPLDNTDLIPWLTERLLNAQKAKANVSNFSSSTSKILTQETPSFEVKSKKITLISRRYASSSSCSSSRSTTPSPYQINEASPRIATGALPARHLVNSSRSGSVLALSRSTSSRTSENCQERVEKQSNNEIPALHRLSLDLPLPERTSQATRLMCKPKKIRSSAINRTSSLQSLPDRQVKPVAPILSCSGFQLQLLQKRHKVVKI